MFRRSQSIRARLVMLVFAAWLPAAAAFGLLAWQTYLRETDAASQQLVQIAQALNLEVEQRLAHGAAVAQTLAGSSMLERPDWEAFYAEATSAVRATDTWILVHSAAAQELNKRVPWPEHRRVLRLNPGPLVAGEPEVRFVERSPRSDEPVVGVFAPDRRQTPRYNVGYGFHASQLQTFLAAQPLPRGRWLR